MAKPDQKTSPNKAALAAKRAKLAAQRFSNMSKSLSGDQLQRAIAEAEYVTRQLSSLTDPAKQLQQRLELINSKISQPLDKIRLAVESASLPSQELAEKLNEAMVSYTANTAALQVLSSSIPQLQQTHAALAGKNSSYQALLKTLGRHKDLLGVEPLKIGNIPRAIISDELQEQKTSIEIAEQEQSLNSQRLDLSLPAPDFPSGSIHPVSQVMDELTEIFADLGFSVAEGPEIEDDWHNFTALNIPETHPARAMQDTFYMNEKGADGAPMVLRTHTSPVQIRTMQKTPPPIRVIAPGRVYRSDSDATHTPMFHQIEGLVIDKAITMGHLKWTLETFLKAFFERDDVHIRMRPSYFPFTEPSAEVDVGWSIDKGRRVVGGSEGWMEVLGSGMVHPKVIAACGLDPEEWQGFAFGTGVDRLAMLKYGMDDLRAFFDGDLRWLKHYGFSFLDVPTLSGGVGA